MPPVPSSRQSRAHVRSVGSQVIGRAPTGSEKQRPNALAILVLRPVDSALAIHQCTEQFVHLSRATTFPSGACLRLRRNQGCAAYCSALPCGGPRPHERALARPVETGAIPTAGGFCREFSRPPSGALQRVFRSSFPCISSSRPTSPKSYLELCAARGVRWSRRVASSTALKTWRAGQGGFAPNPTSW
jgi:hypothetical protein